MGIRNLYQRFKTGLSRKRNALKNRFQTLRSKIHRPSMNNLRRRLRETSNKFKNYTRRVFSRKNRSGNVTPSPTRTNASTNTNNLPSYNVLNRRNTLKQKRNMLLNQLKAAQTRRNALIRERNEMRAKGENLHISKKILKLPYYIQSNLNALNAELVNLNRENK